MKDSKKMKLAEIRERIAGLSDLRPLADNRTFSYRVPDSEYNAIYFVRPIADDVIVGTAVTSTTDEVSFSIAERTH